MDPEVNAFRSVLESGYRNLLDFQFQFFNPIFWVGVFLLFIILCKFWVPKRALSFAITTAIILLFLTELELRMGQVFVSAGESFEPTPVRLVALAAIGIEFLLFTFLK